MSHDAPNCAWLMLNDCCIDAAGCDVKIAGWHGDEVQPAQNRIAGISNNRFIFINRLLYWLHVLNTH
jgi:hypothetical protein